MLKTELLKVARLLDLDAFEVTGNIMVQCPFSPWTHGKNRMQRPPGSMSLEVRPGQSRYNCHACGKSGMTLHIMLMQLQDLGYFKDEPELYDTLFSLVDKAERFIPKHDMSYDEAITKAGLVRLFSPPPDGVPIYEPEWFERFADLYSADGQPGLRYLRNRGVTDEAIKHFNLRYDAPYERVVLPIQWHDGSLIGATGRLIRPAKEGELAHYHYRNFKKGVVLFGENQLEQSPVIVAEGPFDVLRLYQAGFNAVATLGAKFTDDQVGKLVEWGQPVIIFFDPDKAGISASGKLYGALAKSGVKARVYQALESGKDAGDHTERELQDVLNPLVMAFSENPLGRLKPRNLVYWGLDDEQK